MRRRILVKHGALVAVAAGALLFGMAPRPSRAADDFANGAVVHVGDSFVDALRGALGPKFRANKTRYFPIAKTSSYLGTWLHPSRPLAEIQWKYHPSLILFTVGANEMSGPPPPSRIKLVKQIVQAVQPVPCVFVSIPPWKGASTELMEIIKREAAPCRYFDSSVVADRIERQADGAHPTVAGGAVWADAFFAWLLAERDPKDGKPWALKPAAQ